MALKDWKKQHYSTHKGWFDYEHHSFGWKNIKTNITVWGYQSNDSKKLFGNQKLNDWQLEIILTNFISKQLKFKTKKQAWRYAKAYMRKY
jgi:hypothetical protein